VGTKGSIQGRAVKGLAKRNRTYEPERRCSHPGCITRLSAYNGLDTCFVHSKFHTPRLRGRKVA
jgi:hypothetical protein